MEPIVTSELELQFAAPLSAWWLLLLLPLLALGCWLLYRNQYKSIPRHSVLGLTALRLLLLGGLAVLAFRPNLIRRRILTFPGRILFVIDDSESMTAKDTCMDSAQALRLARSFEPKLSGQAAVYHQLAEHLRQVETEIRQLQKFAATVARSDDRFWNKAAAAQDNILASLADFAKLLETAPHFWDGHIREGKRQVAETAALTGKVRAAEEKAKAAAKELSPEAGTLKAEAKKLRQQAAAARRDAEAYLLRFQTFRQQFEGLPERLKELKADLAPFVTGSKDPGPKAYDMFSARLGRLILILVEMQGQLDRDNISAGNVALKTAADDIRARTRLELLAASLSNTKTRLAELTRGQNVQFIRLMTGEPLDYSLEGSGAVAIKPNPGNTDILGRLEALLNEGNDFPLTAVLLFSDGRDLSKVPLNTVVQAYSRRQTPIYTAGMGAAREPVDLAVLEVTAPPFAVAAAPLTVKVRLKTALKEPKSIKLRMQILRENQPVKTAQTEIGRLPEQTIKVSFRPEETGLYRYQVKFAGIKGETFPVKNNSADFAVQVRNDKVKLLFLDWKPRWESRFALNIFQRLDYLELNPIIVITREDGVLRRAVRRGSWPENLAALEMYDLVVLGSLPGDLLSDQEWKDLHTLVAEKGKTLCFIGPAAGGPQAAWPLLPVKLPKKSPQPRADLAALDELRLAPPGVLHPITGGLAGMVASLGAGEPVNRRAGELASPEEYPDTMVLMRDGRTDGPLVSARFLGKGKVLLIDTDQFWRLLNPTMLEAHTRMYVNLISWAVQGGYGEQTAAKAALALDLRSCAAGQPLQLWLRQKESRAGFVEVEAVVDGKVVAKAKTEPRESRGGTRSHIEESESRGGTRSHIEESESRGGTRSHIEESESRGGARSHIEESESRGGTRSHIEESESRGGARSHIEAEAGAGGLGRFVFNALPAKDLVFRLKDQPEVKSKSVVVIADYPELKYLSRREQYLRKLAGATGGEYREFIEFERFFLTLTPRERIEKRETVWRLWNLALVMAFVIIMLTVEWV